MSLDAIGIVSKDIPATLKFYALLDIHLKQFEDSDHYDATTPSGVRIMIDSVDLIKKLQPKWEEPKGSGIVLCFKKDSSELVDETYQKIISAGFVSVTEPWDAFWGQRYASVKDPDGYQIDLFADLR